jgi:TetR/AcrR family transcriptional regulator
LLIAKVKKYLGIDTDRNGQYTRRVEISLTREKIIKASLVVFSHFGKAKSSMAMIAKKADVSKPLLFHHFGNKDKLYRSCQQFTIDKLSTIKTDANQHQNVMTNLKHIQLVKLKLEKSYPGIFKFFSLDQPTLPALPPSPFTGKDMTRFKKGVSSETFWRLLYYLTMGYHQALQHESEVMTLIQDFQESFTMLEKLAIHKEDE